MIGYWFVAAIVLIALVATLIAISRPDPAPPLTGNAPRRPVWFVWSDLATSSPATKSSLADDWIELIKHSLPSELIVIRLPHLAAERTASFSIREATATSTPGDVITCWLGVRHVVESVSLEDFESQLAAVFAQLATTNAAVIVGNLPGIAINAEASAPSSDTTLPRFDQHRWNESIARVAEPYGFPVVDLSTEEVTVVQAESEGLRLTPTSAGVIADRFIAHVASTLDRDAAMNVTNEQQGGHSNAVLTPTSTQSEPPESHPARNRHGDT